METAPYYALIRHPRNKAKWLAVAQVNGTCAADANTNFYVRGVPRPHGTQLAESAEAQKNFGGKSEDFRIFARITERQELLHKLSQVPREDGTGFYADILRERAAEAHVTLPQTPAEAREQLRESLEAEDAATNFFS